MKTQLAIDPGANGGMAWRDAFGSYHCQPMPEGMTGIADLLYELRGQATAQGIAAVVERVGGYMPGNSGPAAVKFARHCGHIDAALYCVGIATEQVAPQVWMRVLGALPKDKAERKRAIKEAMRRRHPYLDVTLKTADALGMLAWAEGRGK